MLFQEFSWGLGATAAAFVGAPTKVLRAIDFNTTVHGDLPAMWKATYEAAQKSAPNSASSIRQGSVPFARLVNLLTNREYVPTYSEETRTFKVQASSSSPWPWRSIALPVVYFIGDSDEELTAYFDKYGGQVASAVATACGSSGNVLGVLHLDAVSAVAQRVAQVACARYKPAPVAPSSVTSTTGGRQVLAPVGTKGGGTFVDLFTNQPSQTPPPGSDPNSRTSVDVSPPPDAGKYKPGSIARFNTTRQVWSVYSPLAGLSGLGADAVEPPVPTGFVKVAEEAGAQLPAGTASAGTEQDKTPLYKRPIFWVGVLVVGGGATYLLTRPRKPKASARAA